MFKRLIKFFRAPLVIGYSEGDGRDIKAQDMAVAIEAKLNRHVIVEPHDFVATRKMS